jgi:NTP pyrophosphatase (non-canonical NTP hydrolase)
MLPAEPRVEDVQRLALRLYGTYDLDKSLLWLTEELGEFVASIRKGHQPRLIAAELGDVLAWLINLSNILDFNLECIIANAFEKERSRQLRVYGALKYWTAHDICTT